MTHVLKRAGIGVLSIALVLALVALPVLFIKGGLWAADRFLPVLIDAGWIVLAIDLLAVVVSIIPHVRPLTGSTLLLSSYLFGVILWLLGLVLTYYLWGLFAVIVGLFVMGIGVVPIAMLATIVKGMWEQFLTLAVLTVLTIGTRLIGIMLASKSAAPTS